MSWDWIEKSGCGWTTSNLNGGVSTSLTTISNLYLVQSQISDLFFATISK